MIETTNREGHGDYVARTRPAGSPACNASHMTPAGRCLNCGWRMFDEPPLAREAAERLAFRERLDEANARARTGIAPAAPGVASTEVTETTRLAIERDWGIAPDVALTYPQGSAFDDYVGAQRSRIAEAFRVPPALVAEQGAPTTAVEIAEAFQRDFIKAIANAVMATEGFAASIEALGLKFRRFAFQRWRRIDRAEEREVRTALRHRARRAARRRRRAAARGAGR